jgi:predicted unusual protein kinase regulating ubiquinone biosynthesis (AarF/ABC1/UbiB family)
VVRKGLVARYLALMMGQVLDGIVAQVDFLQEATLHAEFARNFRGQRGILVPELVPELCDEDMIVMQLVERRGDLTAGGVGDGLRQARLALRCLYQMIFSDGLVHGDLHPGNLLVDDRGDLAIIDFGLAWRRAFAEFFLAFAREDSRECARITLAMAAVSRCKGGIGWSARWTSWRPSSRF